MFALLFSSTDTPCFPASSAPIPSIIPPMPVAAYQNTGLLFPATAIIAPTSQRIPPTPPINIIALPGVPDFAAASVAAIFLPPS
jgi:hypothetical protein